MRTYRDLNGLVHEVNLEKMDYEGPGEMRVRLVDFMGDDASVVEAARVSVKSGLKGTEKDRKLIKYLAEHSHMTPFEHVVFKFHKVSPMYSSTRSETQDIFLQHVEQEIHESRYHFLFTG